MNWLEVRPAYGRDYKNQAEVLAAWNADKDFSVTEGAPYGVSTNRADLVRMKARGEVSGVIVRYARDQKVMDMKI